MKNFFNNLLHRFAVTDGLLRGTAIISNLITTASISMLPGFGVSGLFIANTIQMTVGGLLELPTGILADARGWSRSVKLALGLKFLVTLSFLAAIGASQYGSFEWLWFFVTCEAVIDSFASSFLSGSYQACYYQWYQSKITQAKLDTATAPPLFLSSFRFALRIRFLLPLAAFAFVIIAQFVARSAGIVNTYLVAYISVAVIAILRIIVIVKVSADLKDLPVHAPQIRRSLIQVLKQVPAMTKSRYFALYAGSVFISLVSTFFLIGKTFQLFKSSGVTDVLAWSTGTVFGISIYFIRTMSGVYLFPKLARYSAEPTMRKLLLTISLSCLLLGALASMKWPIAFEFGILLALSILAAVISDAIMRFVDSNLDQVVAPESRATWLSYANGVGMLLYGFTSAIIVIFTLSSISTSVFCIAITLLSAFAWRSLTMPTSNSHVPTLTQVLTRLFRRSIVGIIILFLFVDIANFSITSFREQDRKEKVVTALIHDVIRDAVIQGSFVETGGRLQRIQQRGAFYCSRIEVWQFTQDLCNNLRTDTSFLHATGIDIKVSEQAKESAGRLTLYYDRGPIFSSVFSRLLFTLFILLGCGLILTSVFRKLVLKIQNELSAVVNVGRDSAADPPTVREFQEVRTELQKAFALQAELSEQKIANQIAKQVSHDIRSPLATLDALRSQLDNVSSDQRTLLRSAIDRIRGIADTLVDRQGLTSSASLTKIAPHHSTSSDLITPHPLALLTQEVIAEKAVQTYDSSSRTEIKFVLTEENCALFAHVQGMAFRRSLSNLLDNSIQAMPKGGVIEVTLCSPNEEWCELLIEDHGIGIPPEILAGLGTRGVTHGKPNGSGLGLWYSKESVQNWGGSLVIESNPVYGTRVTLKIPRTTPPAWFCNTLALDRDSTIVIIDDDPSIHQLWLQRLTRPEIQFGPENIYSFRTIKEFKTWRRSASDSSITYLIDHEITGSDNGLSFIIDQHIQNTSILVTSSFEDSAIQSRCEVQKIKLLPKPLIPYAQITVQQ